LVRNIEVWDPLYTDETGERVGRYVEAHDADGITVSMTDFTVSIDAAQADYMSTILPRFEADYDASDATYVPPESV
jgi:hypothetical protein